MQALEVFLLSLLTVEAVVNLAVRALNQVDLAVEHSRQPHPHQ
jgi:hypothetical protein